MIYFSFTIYFFSCRHRSVSTDNILVYIKALFFFKKKYVIIFFPIYPLEFTWQFMLVDKQWIRGRSSQRQQWECPGRVNVAGSD
jgi:hypothetical protein